VPKRIASMKNLTFFILPLVFLLAGYPVSEASWFIDTGQFHASIHGQFSCLDCHGDIQDQKLHPNSANVNRSLKDFFSAEKCSACHDDIIEDLKKGIHGERKVSEGEDYEYCLSCHDPHYQLSRALKLEAGDRFDPGKPLNTQCGACHEIQTTLPEPAQEDEACLACHRALDYQNPKVSAVCLHCHGQEKDGSVKAVKIDTAGLKASSHGSLTCLECHPDSFQYLHSDQKPEKCLKCHQSHEASVDTAVHLKIRCEACHLSDITPVRDLESDWVQTQPDREPGAVSQIHNLVSASDEAACGSCHRKENAVGAAASILPSKSLICVPCHASGFSVRNTITGLSLVVFLIGVLSLISIWAGAASLKNRNAESKGRILKAVSGFLKILFSFKLLTIFKVLFLDALLARKLFRQNFTRWLIHSLIFLPFVFRFLWGMVALIFSEIAGRWPVSWMMLDNNHALTAFLFDLTGVLVILGVVLAVLRRLVKRSEKIPGLPGPDWFALALMGFLIISGFFLEANRITMTGSPAGAGYAFAGNTISRLMPDGFGSTTAYVYSWYFHAILTGIFIAYLPFSRMLHIIMAPVSVVINAVMTHEKK